MAEMASRQLFLGKSKARKQHTLFPEVHTESDYLIRDGDNGPKVTNNRAELKACMRAIEIAKEKKIPKLVIRTDSEYVVNCMEEWVEKWKNNDMKKFGYPDEDVKNQDIIDKILEYVKEFNGQIEWEWVPRDDNWRADKLAGEGLNKGKSIQLGI